MFWLFRKNDYSQTKCKKKRLENTPHSTANKVFLNNYDEPEAYTPHTPSSLNIDTPTFPTSGFAHAIETPTLPTISAFSSDYLCHLPLCQQSQQLTKEISKMDILNILI